jgi:23S rRNA pseudouridine955/2504/2580 synthase
LGSVKEKPMITYIKISTDDVGRRLDAFVRDRLSWPQGKIQRALRSKDIRCNDAKTMAEYRLALGDTLRIYEGEGGAERPAPKVQALVPLSRADRETLKNMILYEDDVLIALNKPATLASQGGTGITRALDQMMVAWWQYEGWEGQPRLVHRLDRPTTGVMIMAKTRVAAEALSSQIRSHTFTKVYEALVYGVPPKEGGVLRAPLLLHQGFVRIDPDGQEAQTHWRVIRTYQDALAHLELRPKQGRMHQLRVHCMSMGHPIIGDRKYGRVEPLPLRLASGLHLHARSVTFAHPTTGEEQTVTAPILNPMHQSIEALWSPNV